MEWTGLSPEEWTAVRLSLKVAVVATLVGLPFGLAVATALARGRFWGLSLLNGLVLMPLILPPVVTGYLLLVLFGRRGVIGSFLAEHLGIVFSFRWTGAALASGVMGFPLMVRAMRLSIEAVDARLEEAASTLGANRAWVFATVTLPLIAPAVVAGWMLAFTLSLDDLVIASFTTGPGATTLPIRIYSEVRLGVKPEINAVCTIMIAVVAAGVIAASLLSKLRESEANKALPHPL